MIAGFTPLSQRPIDAFLPHMHKILGPRENGPRRLSAGFDRRIRDVNFLLPTDIHRSAFVRYSSPMK